MSSRTGMAGLFNTGVVPGDPLALPAPRQRVQARRQLLELLPVGYLDASIHECLSVSRW